MRLSEIAPGELQQLLRSPDLDAALRATSDPEGRARYLMRAHLLEQIGAAMRGAGTSAMLVKGAALALTHYASPWVRDMADIDLLVRPGELGKVLQALAAAGLRAAPPAPSRSLTSKLFGETAMLGTIANASFTVEVHTMLDKLVARPLDMAAIFARAREAPGLPGLVVPADEDHLLLVALHEAADGFGHMVGFIDLLLLLRSGPDHAALIARARVWRLASALYVMLASLRSISPSLVPAQLVQALAPGRLRLAALARYYAVGSFPVARHARQLGLPWVVRQTPLRDDLAVWGLGVARYAAMRSIERLGLT